MTNTPPPTEAYGNPIKLRLVWHLEDVLTRYSITKYALKKETGMSHNTIIFLCREETDRFNISNAEKLLNALRVLSYEKRKGTGEDLTISDLVTIQTTTLEGEVLDIGKPKPKPLVVPSAEPLLVPDEVQTLAPAASKGKKAATKAKDAKPEAHRHDVRGAGGKFVKRS